MKEGVLKRKLEATDFIINKVVIIWNSLLDTIAMFKGGRDTDLMWANGINALGQKRSA